MQQKKQMTWEDKNNAMMEKSKWQYTEINHTEIIMAANTSGTALLSINNYGSFKSFIMVGSYSTLNGGVDDGVCRTKLLIEDTGLNRRICNSLIPANLLLTPGREKKLPASGDASNFLFFPLKFNYFFQKNSEIQVNWLNNADQENYVNMVWYGDRYDTRK